MPKQIITDRLALSPLTENDCDFIFRLVNTPGWLTFIGDRNVYSHDDALTYIRKIIATPDLTYRVINLVDGNIAIGIISFLKRDYLDHFDIGFALLPQYGGQGYAYEAAKAVLDIESRKPEHTTILATTLPENERSIRLLTKMGMSFQKEMVAGSTKFRVYAYSTHPARTF